MNKMNRTNKVDKNARYKARKISVKEQLAEISVEEFIPSDKVILELLEISQKLYKSRLAKNPESINNLSKASSFFELQDEGISVFIERSKMNSNGDISDFGLKISGYRIGEKYEFQSYYIKKLPHSSKPKCYYCDLRGRHDDISKEVLTTLHETMVKHAQKEGVRFASTIDYNKVSSQIGVR